MPLTINETCDKLHVSKMTLYKYLHNIIMEDHHQARKTYINTKHQRIITDDLYKTLKKVINGKHQRSKPNSKVYINKITILQHDNAMLKQSVKAKDTQIQQQNKQLDHQQILQLGSQKELKSVRKELSEAKNNLLTYKKQDHHKSTVKHGLWWHLTHKW